MSWSEAWGHPSKNTARTGGDQVIDPRRAKAGIVVIDGARLRELRRERGLSQFTLASQAAVDVSTVARLEHQRGPAFCRFWVRSRLATALGAETRFLEPAQASDDHDSGASTVRQTAREARS
jgi:ribosome-binding protein aMBF1 (putative translation factor)